MKNLVKKITVRLPEKDIATIEEYPGKNISEKTRAILAAYTILINEEPGADLAEKYEMLLKGYLKEFHPKLNKEIEERRKELNRYRDTLKALDELYEISKELQKRIDGFCIQSAEYKANEIQEQINEFCRQSKEYIEKAVAECVVVRKNPERSSKWHTD